MYASELHVFEISREPLGTSPRHGVLTWVLTTIIIYDWLHWIEKLGFFVKNLSSILNFVQNTESHVPWTLPDFFWDLFHAWHQIHNPSSSTHSSHCFLLSGSFVPRLLGVLYADFSRLSQTDPTLLHPPRVAVHKWAWIKHRSWKLLRFCFVNNAACKSEIMRGAEKTEHQQLCCKACK